MSLLRLSLRILLVSCTLLEALALRRGFLLLIKILLPPVFDVFTPSLTPILVAGVDKALGSTNYKGGIGDHDFLLCFLPLAHILEFVYELCGILWGGTIGYATVKTLTEASTRNCKGDIKEFRPTILVG